MREANIIKKGVAPETQGKRNSGRVQVKVSLDEHPSKANT